MFKKLIQEKPCKLEIHTGQSQARRLQKGVLTLSKTNPFLFLSKNKLFWFQIGIFWEKL